MLRLLSCPFIYSFMGMQVHSPCFSLAFAFLSIPRLFITDPCSPGLYTWRTRTTLTIKPPSCPIYLSYKHCQRIFSMLFSVFRHSYPTHDGLSPQFRPAPPAPARLVPVIFLSPDLPSLRLPIPSFFPIPALLPPQSRRPSWPTSWPPSGSYPRHHPASFSSSLPSLPFTSSTRATRPPS